MSTIDPSSAASQQAIFDRLGINTQTNAADRGAKETLGQQDFLKLMVTQLQNQDPFAPMENGDFIAQMAQFSSVAGIEEINTNLTSLADQLKQSRIATATSLLGSSVLVPGTLARPDDEGAIHGVLDLPRAASEAQITFSDAETGEILHQTNLGAQQAGLVGFNWTNLPERQLAENRPIRVGARVNFGDGPVDIGASVYSRVVAARMDGTAAQGLTLEVMDYGDVAADSVSAFR